MNADTIARWLDAAGVPAGVVSIGAEVDNAWCLLRRDGPEDGHDGREDGHVASADGHDGREGGSDGPEWEVFWREQGNRYDWARFSNEHVACCYLFGRLTWTQVASGALTPRDAAR